MKYARILIFIIVLTFVLSGCTSISKSKSEKIAQNFIKSVYTFHDAKQIVDYDTYYKARDKFAENLKPFMTKNTYKKFSIDNDPYKIVEVAAKGRFIFDIENIKLKVRKEYKEEDSIHYEYTADIILTPLEDSRMTSKTIRAFGEVRISKESKELKISYFKSISSSEWMAILNELDKLT